MEKTIIEISWPLPKNRSFWKVNNPAYFSSYGTSSSLGNLENSFISILEIISSSNSSSHFSKINNNPIEPFSVFFINLFAFSLFLENDLNDLK